MKCQASLLVKLGLPILKLILRTAELPILLLKICVNLHGQKQQYFSQKEISHFTSVTVSDLPVEGQPFHTVTKDNPRCHKQLGKMQGIDPLFFVLLELQPRAGKEVYGILRVHVLPEGEKQLCVQGATKSRLILEKFSPHCI